MRQKLLPTTATLMSAVVEHKYRGKHHFKPTTNLDRGTSGNCYPGNKVKIVSHRNAGEPSFIIMLHGDYECGSIVKKQTIRSIRVIKM